MRTNTCTLRMRMRVSGAYCIIQFYMYSIGAFLARSMWMFSCWGAKWTIDDLRCDQQTLATYLFSEYGSWLCHVRPYKQMHQGFNLLTQLMYPLMAMTVEIGLDQLTPSSVARVFSVNPFMVTISGQLSLETGNSLSFSDLIYNIILKKKYPKNRNLRWGQWSSWPD